MIARILILSAAVAIGAASPHVLLGAGARTPTASQILHRSDKEMVRLGGVRYTNTELNDLPHGTSLGEVRGAATTTGVNRLRYFGRNVCLWGKCVLQPRGRFEIVAAGGRAAERVGGKWQCGGSRQPAEYRHLFEPTNMVPSVAGTMLSGSTTWRGVRAWVLRSVRRTKLDRTTVTLLISKSSYTLLRMRAVVKVTSPSPTSEFQWRTYTGFGIPRQPISLPKACTRRTER